MMNPSSERVHGLHRVARVEGRKVKREFASVSE